MTGHRRVSSSKPDDPGRRAARFPQPRFVEDRFEATVTNGPAADDHARVGAATDYANPREVLRDPKLSVEQKRDLLRQWAFDAYRMEVATTEGMPPSTPSRLDETIDALIDLDGGTVSISKLSRMHPSKRGQAA